MSDRYNSNEQLQFHPAIANLFGFKPQKLLKLTKARQRLSGPRPPNPDA